MPEPEDILRNARITKGFTQEQMAERLEISHRNYQRYEDGLFPKFRSLNIKKIDDILGTALFPLLYDKQITQEPTENYITKRRNQKNSQNVFMVPLLPVKARAGYIKSFDQTDFLNTLEQYALPPGINPRGATWRYFEVGGSSMEPTLHSGDIILCSMVPYEDWGQLRNFYIYVIVTETQVLVKRLYAKSKTTWVMISDNEKEYPQELITIVDVRELWVFRRHIDSKAPPPKKIDIKI